MIESPLLKSTLGFIDGRWCDAESRATIDVINPANGDLLAMVPRMELVETEQAVMAADRRFLTVSAPGERADWLRGIGDSIVDNRSELARIITSEHGKPLTEAVAEADYAAGFFHYYATAIGHLNHRVLSEQPRNHGWSVYSRPAGVVGLITPWNFPIAMLAKKFSAALAAGCCCVIKPSSKTPLATIAFFHLLENLGLPAGLANLVTGTPSKISQVLCRHSAVRVISFTGSTEVGRQLMLDASGQLKRLSLELGGNAPFIVFADANLESAAQHLVQNKFRASGQTCVCANRIYVQQDVAGKFTEILAARVSKLKVGNGLEDGVDVGPLIDRKGFEKVLDHVDDAVAKGATLALGKRPALNASDQYGAFFPPVILTGVTGDMKCVSDETFGPLVPIIEFESEEEVVAAANGTEYGLAAYVFSADDALVMRVAACLQFGHVGVNTGTGPTAEAPFGGFKQSGFGREGGLEGLHDFIEHQTIARPI